MKRLHSTACGILLLIAPVVAAGQDRSAVGGPVLGVAQDAAHTLRPVLGIPGASVLGKPLDTGVAVTACAAAPSGEYALASASDDGRVLLLDFRGGVTAMRAIEGAANVPDSILLSPNASAAALYHGDGQRVETITGLPDAPAIAGSIDFAGIGAAPVAVSDDGTAVLAIAGDRESRVLFFLGTSGERKAIASGPGIAAAAFLNGSSDALIADGASQQILLIRDPAGAAGVTSIAVTGISNPVAVAAAAGNRRFVAADRSGKIASANADGSASILVDCGCEPAGLFRMNGDALFRLNEISSGPLWIFDGTRAFFVPPDAPPVDGGDGQ